MDDFIALRCPSCGGEIQVGRFLDKCFCAHCGTKLMLNRQPDGAITPFIARDLEASATLKEAQATTQTAALLKQQMNEYGQATYKIRGELIIFLEEGHGFFDTRKLGKVQKILNQYSRMRNLPAYKMPLTVLENSVAMKHPGFETAEDLYLLYEFISKPEYASNPTVIELRAILEPIASIYPPYIQKTREYQTLMNSKTSDLSSKLNEMNRTD